MRILLINGNTSTVITDRVAAEARRVASPGTDIKAVTAEFGATVILSRVDNVIAAHAVVTAFAKHCADADAAIIAVSTDTGLLAVRECASIPVVGMTEASLLTACALGGQFGLLVFDRRALSVFRQVVAMHGQSARMAGAHAVEMTTADFMNPDRVRATTLSGINVLARDMGADTVVVTGATMAGVASSLQAESPVPLLDGISCSVLQAELLVRLRLPKAAVGGTVPDDLRDLVGVDPALASFLSRG